MNLFRNRKAEFLDNLKTIVASHPGSLVVLCAARIKIAVFDHRFERIRIPAFAGRHDVNVCQHRHRFIAFTEFDVTGQSVKFKRFKTVAFPDFQKLVQCFLWSGTKRCFRRSF